MKNSTPTATKRVKIKREGEKKSQYNINSLLLFLTRAEVDMQLLVNDMITK